MNLVFDLDNTLINRNEAYGAWLKNLLKANTVTAKDWQAIYAKDKNGFTPRINFYKYLIEQFDLKMEPDFLIKKCSLELHQYIKPDILLLGMLYRLAQKYTLVLASNGGQENQINKLKASKLIDCFAQENIFISETINFRKPEENFFKFIENKFPKATKMMMIGDDPINDIAGAKQVAWKTVFLSQNKETSINFDYTIQNILEIESLLQRISI